MGLSLAKVANNKINELHQKKPMCLALPAPIIELLPNGMARIELDGMRKEISLDLVEDVQVGDYVIVHVGYALQKLDPDEAAETLALFAEFAKQA